MTTEKPEDVITKAIREMTDRHMATIDRAHEEWKRMHSEIVKAANRNMVLTAALLTIAERAHDFDQLGDPKDGRFAEIKELARAAIEGRPRSVCGHNPPAPGDCDWCEGAKP